MEQTVLPSYEITFELNQKRFVPCKVDFTSESFPSYCVARLVLQESDSLRSKRFHLVSEQRKTGFGRARNEMRAKKMKEGRGGGEGRKRLQTNPSILKTCVRQRTQQLIGN